ncbi:MAG TPA: Arm DNA-binding domain-containing protein [Acidimicrobiales bacterium]|nr:Arm DNA-binding domain-containing protein [Acidimicrobiales bacterium]
MRGSIRARGKTITAYWFTHDPGTGRRKQHSKGGFRTKGAAREHLNELLGKVQTGGWSPDKKITIGELLVEWLAAKKSQGLRATTLAQYQDVVDAWLVPHVGGVQLAKFSPSQAQQLAETLRVEGSRAGGALSPRSVQLSLTGSRRRPPGRSRRASWAVIPSRATAGRGHKQPRAPALHGQPMRPGPSSALSATTA